MMRVAVLMPLAVLAASACSGQATPVAKTGADYTVLGTDLDRLRDDFNAAAGKVRLLYVVGPTCPVCLRGMDELGRALAGERSDPRLQTFVVYVPELHATTADIGPTVSLIPGKYVSRYWDPAQTTEKLFEARLKTVGPAWDVWMVYGPEQRWDGVAPPVPDFWMDQLYGMPQWRYLDAAAFAKQVESRLATDKANGA